MREAIGGTWITQLVITFMFLFVAFLALSINYSRAYKTKNEVMSIIEKKNGITQESINILSNYLRNIGYKESGRCPKGYYGVTIRENGGKATAIKEELSAKKYNLCIAKNPSSSVNFKGKSFYEVRLFFKFNLPIIGNIYVFHVDGQTKDVSYPLDKTEGVCTKNNIGSC